MGVAPTNITKQWADGPFQLIETPRKRLGITDPKKASGAINAASEMALVHNFIIRPLNCIYLQAPNVKLEQDIADFVIFMHAWGLVVHEHHETEEELSFPWLEQDIGIENYMEKDVEQHHAFAPGLKQFDEYVAALRAGKEDYDGGKVRALIDNFAPILTEHLSGEIQTFEGLEKFGDRIKWKKWGKKVGDHAVLNANKEYGVPLVATNLDITFEGSLNSSVWPPWPWIAGVIFRSLFIPKHKGAWRFSCCDAHGMPKELEFV